MGELRLINISKVYGDTFAVADLNLTVHDGEFLTLLGPSGCGKTTTLRMIAGFARPSTGELRLDERVITSVPSHVFLPPERRRMGMVFQSYAVWPHMDVFQNIAYPLKFQRLDKATIQERVQQTLSLVKLDGLGERYPHQLSGGQQQRVALGRALIMEPEILLLDEPLSNLDAKLREQMRVEIRVLQRRVGVTIVYVTHDQVEAITMSDRIAVMNNGRVLQIGSPQEIYELPADRFVAGFVGTANFINARVKGRQGDRIAFRLQGTDQTLLHPFDHALPGEEVTIIVRPENVRLCPVGQSGLSGIVARRTYRGDRLDYVIKIGEHRLQVETTTGDLFDDGTEVGLEMNTLAVVARD